MADTVGNRLGSRGTFDYESDTGTEYVISLDKSVSAAVGNVESADVDKPVIRASQSRPIRPRYILLQLKSNPSVTKRAIIGDIANALWTSNAASEVTINSVVFVITGRVGEARSVLKKTAA